MIKAVIFDVGGVLVRTQDHAPRRRWEEKLGLQPWESEQIVFFSDVGTAAQKGECSDEEFWSWLGGRLRLDEGQLKAFRRDFWSGDVVDDALVALIRALRPKYQTAIISNATDSLRRLLQQEHQIADAFDLIVCSAEENVMKPDPEIYRRALSRLNRKPAEAVFIDDNQENVATAQTLGMNAIRYQEGLDLAAALRQMGIEVPDAAEAQHDGGTYHA